MIMSSPLSLTGCNILSLCVVRASVHEMNGLCSQMNSSVTVICVQPAVINWSPLPKHLQASTFPLHGELSSAIASLWREKAFLYEHFLFEAAGHRRIIKQAERHVTLAY